MTSTQWWLCGIGYVVVMILILMIIKGGTAGSDYDDKQQ